VSQRNPPARETLGLTICGALGVWIGIHVLRTYLAALIWYVSREATTAEQIGAVSLGVFSVGLLAGVAIRLFGGWCPAWRFGLLLVALLVAWHALPANVSQPAVSFAAWVVWLWWFPAFLRELSRRNAATVIAPSLLLGLAAQVAGQTALNGLDLPLLAGFAGLVASILPGGAFVGALYVTLVRDRRISRTHPVTETNAVWTAFVAGPFLFIQLTFLVNLGRLQVMSGWDLWPVALVVGLSLGVALASLTWAPSRVVMVSLGIVAMALLAPGEWMVGWSILAVVPLQAALALLLHAAGSDTNTRGPGKFYVASAAGWLMFFGLFYGFYTGAAAPLTWVVAALAVSAPAIWLARPARLPALRPAAAAVAVVTLGVGISALLLPLSDVTATDERDPGEIRMVTYNVHQGYDERAMPSAAALADVIAEADADLIALQEVHRGANIAGGADLISYLRWRFPDYDIVFGPSYTSVMGNAIMTRYPIREWGIGQYPPGETFLTRGYVWVIVEIAHEDLLFASTHLSSTEEPDEIRAAQADALLAYWGGRPRSILAGDFNSFPDSAAVGTLLESGLKDVVAELDPEYIHDPSEDWLNRRLDYIFTSQDFEPISTRVVFSPASDHPAVIATVRLREDSRENQ
jgi:endonuclease/exonuclease/phosphatase family metal-dependent hydrolase